MVRKGFHLMVVIMFVPALFFQPDFLRLALSLAFAVFLVIEMIRVWQIPPFGEAVHRFLKAFTDSRDSDLLIVSHFSLLLGCAVPVWLSTSPFMDRPLAPYAGILSLGIGDTMASVIGYNFGSVRLSSSSNKTVEGTIAGKMAASGSACCKFFFCWQHS
jgi:dolichol kinase